ncbi:17115_t:CDS:1, partial [Dentiscutata erythropus]
VIFIENFSSISSTDKDSRFLKHFSQSSFDYMSWTKGTHKSIEFFIIIELLTDWAKKCNIKEWDQ